MGETIVTVIAIGLAAVLMFVFPLMTMADRADDVSQLTIQTETSNFVTDVRTTGKLTMDKYSKFIENISSTGNTYDVEMEIKTLDENPSKKTSQAQSTKIGENVYTSIYTSQIMEQLESGTIYLKEGDIFSVSVKNTNITLSQQLKNFAYKVTGNDTYSQAAQDSGMVTANGTGK